MVSVSGAKLKRNEISIAEGLNDKQLISALDTVKDVRILHFKDVPAVFKGFTDPKIEKAFQVCLQPCKRQLHDSFYSNCRNTLYLGCTPSL